MYLNRCFLIFLLFATSCSLFETQETLPEEHTLEYGGDFSLVKKIEDSGGLYKVDGVVKEGLEIFSEKGFTWAKLRIFHSPGMVGALCNDLDYTIALAQEAKGFGMNVLLNFHYSDSWADAGHQDLPDAWKNTTFTMAKDSIYVYSRKVMEQMYLAGVEPDMVQIGNEINNGIIWPHGKLWHEPGPPNWDLFSSLLNSAIRGIRDAQQGTRIPVLIHGACGSNLRASYKFYESIIARGVDFDVIGLSYYPWWHGDFDALENVLLNLTQKFTQDIFFVETAYYSNDWYPKPEMWFKSAQPFPPDEDGQYDFMYELATLAQKYPHVKTLIYSKPDEMEVPKSKINYIGTSLFTKDGHAYRGISAWKNVGP